LRVDVENDAPERKQPVFDHLAYPEFRCLHVVHFSNLLRYLAQPAHQFNPAHLDALFSNAIARLKVFPRR
jgi:hypothetical protein